MDAKDQNFRSVEMSFSQTRAVVLNQSPTYIFLGICDLCMYYMKAKY